LLAGAQEVLTHPFVIGELTLGGLSPTALALLRKLDLAPVGKLNEVQSLIEHGLVRRGVGYVDAHLLVSARLMAARLWSLDLRLAAVAAAFSVEYRPPATP
jgi:predicted nucleic acid-binding protein